jgi:hypothetical protein
MTSVMARLGRFWAWASTCAPGKPNIVAAAQTNIFQIRIFGEPPGDYRFAYGRRKLRCPQPDQTPSFRDGPEDQTRNLEIPGSMLRIAPE